MHSFYIFSVPGFSQSSVFVYMDGNNFVPIHSCFSFLLTSAVLDLRQKALCNRSGGILMNFFVVFSPACPHAFSS